MFSLLTTLLILNFTAHATAHVSMIAILGSNGIIGHGFGVHTDGKYPRTGTEGDAGGDAGLFETGTDNPSPACGSTPELGELDTPAWLSQAEGFGLPAAYSNLSIVAEVFQVNRDGGGPMNCEYNQDATATSWQPMTMNLNQAGNDGLLDENRQNSTVVMSFPPGAVCNGGWTKTACIVRCRTGVNKRFGGCFAVKLSDSTTASVSAMDSNATSLTASQVTSLAQQVLTQMKASGLVVDAKAGSATGASLAQRSKRSFHHRQGLQRKASRSST